MERLPESVGVVLEALFEDLKARESISSIGLFGSWSRGDAVPSSDVDLLVVDGRDFDYEYVERAEIAGVFLDLDYMPEKWVQKQVPPELDQKLYEVEVLYDRSGALAKAKGLTQKFYWQPERIEIRTGNYLMEADTYLSRGLSAYGKDDFQSAKVNAAIGLEAVLKILVDASKVPLSNSHFIRALESSTKKFGADKLYDDYLEVAGLSEVNRQKAESMLDSLLAMWGETMSFVEANSSFVKKLHVRVLNDLNYYCKQSFLRGMSARTVSLIKEGLFGEAARYVFRTSISMLENYVWLLSVMDDVRFDYTDLFRRLKRSGLSPAGIYRKAVEAFEIEEVPGRKAEDSLRRAKEIILGVRQKRKKIIAAAFA
ncbi:MAG: nucleotidyltransferase domain-containing protein [Candidatus Bathyarchaeota archaeon]|nr:nucleotidyltransferase domain-containing protein [Candidatus Bathyarchaeota archaeon]